MTSYEFERALVYLAEQIIKTFGKDVGVQEPKQEPTEPLIRDEKIRKAVRAWAEANNLTYYTRDVVFDHSEHRLRWINVIIEFDMMTGLEDLEDGKTYSIAELCGEEQE